MCVCGGEGEREGEREREKRNKKHGVHHANERERGERGLDMRERVCVILATRPACAPSR